MGAPPKTLLGGLAYVRCRCNGPIVAGQSTAGVPDYRCDPRRRGGPGPHVIQDREFADEFMRLIVVRYLDHFLPEVTKGNASDWWDRVHLQAKRGVMHTVFKSGGAVIEMRTRGAWPLEVTPFEVWWAASQAVPSDIADRDAEARNPAWDQVAAAVQEHKTKEASWSQTMATIRARYENNAQLAPL